MTGEVSQMEKENSWLKVRIRQVEDINKELALKKNQTTAMLRECHTMLEHGHDSQTYHKDLAHQIYKLLRAHGEIR